MKVHVWARSIVMALASAVGALLAVIAWPAPGLLRRFAPAGATRTQPAVHEAQPAGTNHSHEETVREAMRSRSDHEVLRLWQTSYVVLFGRQSAEELTRVVEIRHACLEEFERRYPEGFRRWIPGARAAGDPTAQLRAVEPDTRPEQ